MSSFISQVTGLRPQPLLLHIRTANLLQIGRYFAETSHESAELELGWGGSLAINHFGERRDVIVTFVMTPSAILM